MELHANHLHYNKETQTFSAELSDLSNRLLVSEACWHKRPITVKNPKTGKSVEFKWDYNDMDSTQEDTYGFNYVATVNKKTINLLLIND